MDLLSLQKKKEQPFKYLISKGFHLKVYLRLRDEAPHSLQEYITTKRIVSFVLTDRKGVEVDSICVEYGPCESEWERMWRSLSI